METIMNKMDWIRSIQRGETKTGRLSSPKECSTMSVLIYRWNIEEGLGRGIRISACYDRANSTITITGNKISNLKELLNAKKKNAYVDK